MERHSRLTPALSEQGKVPGPSVLQHANSRQQGGGVQRNLGKIRGSRARDPLLTCPVSTSHLEIKTQETQSGIEKALGKTLGEVARFLQVSVVMISPPKHWLWGSSDMAVNSSPSSSLCLMRSSSKLPGPVPPDTKPAVVQVGRSNVGLASAGMAFTSGHGSSQLSGHVTKKTSRSSEGPQH